MSSDSKRYCFGVDMSTTAGAVFGLALAAMGCQPRSWTVVSSEVGGFEIEMPSGNIERRTESLALAGGGVDVHWWAVAFGESLLHDHVGYYLASYAELDRSDYEATLNEIERLVVASVEGEKIRVWEISRDRYSGRIILMNTSAGSCAKVAIYLTNKRLYQLMVGGDCEGESFQSRGERFLGSFRLLE